MSLHRTMSKRIITARESALPTADEQMQSNYRHPRLARPEPAISSPYHIHQAPLITFHNDRNGACYCGETRRSASLSASHAVNLSPCASGEEKGERLSTLRRPSRARRHYPGFR